MKYLTSILVVSLAVSAPAGAHETLLNRQDWNAKQHDRDDHHTGHHGGGKGDNCDGNHPGHGHPKPPTLPAAPTQLMAEAVAEFQINLTWSEAATNELGFKIERSRDGTNYLQIAQLLPNVTSYQDPGLLPDTKYFYRTRAFNKAGNSPYSNVARAQTFAPACDLSVGGWQDFQSVMVPMETSPFAAIATGNNHGLALKNDGTVTGWIVDLNSGAAPLPKNLTKVIAIAAGGNHSLALRCNGTVAGWSLADDDSANPPLGLTGVVAIAAGSRHSLALKSNGTVVGWGDNQHGAARPPENLQGVVAIAAGGYHSLALQSDGTVVGWGFNAYGQAKPPAKLTGVAAIAAGEQHSLALLRDGTVVVWGGVTTDAATAPANLTGVTAIAAGDEFSMALRADGTVVHWGYAPPGSSHVWPQLEGVAAITASGSQFLVLTTTPNPPVAIGLSVPASNRVAIAWQDNSAGHNAFLIERAPLAGIHDAGEWQQIGAVGNGETNFNDTTVTTDMVYGYRVRAENACRVSAPSRWGVVTVTPPISPSADATLVSDGGLRITSLIMTNTGALITWSALGNTTNIVEASANLAGDFSAISPHIVIGGSGNLTNYIDVGALTNSSSRFYRIRLVP